MCTPMSWNRLETGVELCSRTPGLMPSKVTFTAGSSVFTNDLHHHETCVASLDRRCSVRARAVAGDHYFVKSVCLNDISCVRTLEVCVLPHILLQFMKPCFEIAVITKCGYACHRASICIFHHIYVNNCISLRVCACKRVSKLV
jgi:hypothetical protein